MRSFEHRTFRIWGVVALAAAALVGGAPNAWASSCARVDATLDMLSPQEQKAALLLFEEALRQAGRVVDPASCSEEWVVSHAQLGDSLIVVVAGPQGRRSDRVRGVEELPAQYSQSIRALIRGGDPRDELAGIVDRTNVTSAQVDLQRVSSEGFFFVRLGYGYASGPGNGGAPAIGLGWRKELNRVALDVSVANLLVIDSEEGDRAGADPLGDAAFTPVALGVNYNFRPLSNGTPYAGFGLAFTAWGVDKGEGRGLDVRLSAGYEMLRASTVRLFLQADAILPTYEVTRRVWDASAYDWAREGERFRPLTFAVSLGIGFGGGQDDDD